MRGSAPGRDEVPPIKRGRARVRSYRIRGAAGSAAQIFSRPRGCASRPHRDAMRCIVQRRGAGCWLPGTGTMPLEEAGSTTVMVSVDPSGHTTWKVEPAGNVENGIALLAR